jgi:hypothetical protein
MVLLLARLIGVGLTTLYEISLRYCIAGLRFLDQAVDRRP